MEELPRELALAVERADQAVRDEFVTVAERLCLDVIERFPKCTGALTILYQIRKAQGNTSAAQALIKQVVVLSPNDFYATNELTMLLFANGNMSRAKFTRGMRSAWRRKIRRPTI